MMNPLMSPLSTIFYLDRGLPWLQMFLAKLRKRCGEATSVSGLGDGCRPKEEIGRAKRAEETPPRVLPAMIAPYHSLSVGVQPALCGSTRASVVVRSKRAKSEMSVREETEPARDTCHRILNEEGLADNAASMRVVDLQNVQC